MQQNSPADKKNMSYRDAGVDIDAGEQLVQRIKPLVKETHRPGVLGSLGGFGGLFELPWQEYRAPVMVTGTDGVGTKLNLAIRNNRYDTIGIDLVAMCVNDIIVTGAEPLVFLDYFATSKLDTTIATTVIAGIAEGCKMAGCALVGGETAEMPGMYRDKDFDLAGFSVGLVEKSEIIDGSLVQAGDTIIGLASSGPHSNGFSLINKLLQERDVTSQDNGADILDALLQPTRIYVKSVLSVLGRSASTDSPQPLKALAHITGGGLLENIPRVLPAGVTAQINSDSWQMPGIFQWIQQQGNITPNEMYRVFNCGIGMIAIVQSSQVTTTLKAFQDAGESAMEIGTIEKMDNSAADPAVVMNGTGSF